MASATTADDSSRIAAATTWSHCAGVHTVGFAGQLMAMPNSILPPVRLDVSLDVSTVTKAGEIYA
jgi:hypothetical protein